ncbi:MAG: energy transducer TonB [Gammaproteobacteria bacterium]|nr:energy transducer TonB [Gammaproteobacteria bacterium]
MYYAIAQTYRPHGFDRMGLTIFLALVLHALVILGISFAPADPTRRDLTSTMEITLVDSHAKQAPDKADYLAQANQLGGGNVEEKVRPSSPFANPLPTNEQGIAPNSELAMTPPPLVKAKKQKELLSAQESPFAADSTEHKREVKDQTMSVTAAQLFERSREVIAMTRAEISDHNQVFQQAEQHNGYTGVNARQYRYAAYIESWRDKVERVGSLNYPEEAIRSNLNGQCYVEVLINADGTVRSVNVLRSSGYSLLDSTALRIVKMAEPYPPLPPEIRKETEVLPIRLEWNFRVKQGLRTSVR